jgi:predicted enzyme related to lactoylglutathione lyase
MTLPQLSLVVIRATNLEATVAFYQTIGLVFQEEQHGSGPRHYSCIMGEVVLEIYPPRVHTLPDTNLIGFRVADLDETLHQLSGIGFQTENEPKTSTWGRWVNLLDPDGRTVQLSEL